MSAFVYPQVPVTRRHAPRGYGDFSSYKPWLRDEFTFKCIYCRWREVWEGSGAAAFGIDHVAAKSENPTLECWYENLVYACNACNSVKNDQDLDFDPSNEALARHLEVDANGQIIGKTLAGKKLIRLLRLDSELRTGRRRRMLRLEQLVDINQEIRILFGYPDDLPDLSVLRPPEGNERPEGVSSSWYEMRRTGLLPSSD